MLSEEIAVKLQLFYLGNPSHKNKQKKDGKLLIAINDFPVLVFHSWTQ